MGKKEEFIEWFKQEEKSLIVAIGKEDWQNEKVYFVEEINIFVNKYLKSLNNWISVEDVTLDEIRKIVRKGVLISDGERIKIVYAVWSTEIYIYYQPLPPPPKD